MDSIIQSGIITLVWHTAYIDSITVFMSIINTMDLSHISRYACYLKANDYDIYNSNLYIFILNNSVQGN